MGSGHPSDFWHLSRWVKVGSGTCLPHSNHTGITGQGCCVGESQQVCTVHLHHSFLECRTFCVTYCLWLIQLRVVLSLTSRSKLPFISTHYSTVMSEDEPSLLFWLLLKKKKPFPAIPSFLLPLRSYHVLLSCLMPSSLACFPKLLALVALMVNSQMQICDAPSPQRPPPFILWTGPSEGQVVFAVPFSVLAVSEHHCQTPWGWASELLDNPWLSACTCMHKCTLMRVCTHTHTNAHRHRWGQKHWVLWTLSLQMVNCVCQVV